MQWAKRVSMPATLVGRSSPSAVARWSRVSAACAALTPHEVESRRRWRDRDRRSHQRGVRPVPHLRRPQHPCLRHRLRDQGLPRRPPASPCCWAAVGVTVRGFLEGGRASATSSTWAGRQRLAGPGPPGPERRRGREPRVVAPGHPLSGPARRAGREGRAAGHTSRHSGQAAARATSPSAGPSRARRRCHRGPSGKGPR